jgi:UDP:flavonoid glycosyltransferase YjiC (YdhE family)
MAKILFITSGFSGIVNSSFEVIRRLENEGHEVIYASMIAARRKVEYQGFTYHDLPEWHKEPVVQAAKNEGALSKLRSLLSAYLSAKKRRAAGIDRLGQLAFQEDLKSICPDLVLLDIECHEYIFTTYASGLPFLLVSQWFNGKYAPGLPPITSNLRASDGKEKIEARWKARKARFQTSFRKQRLMTAGTGRRSLLLEYGQQAGFPLRLLSYYDWPTPFTYRELPILHFTDEALELPHEIPPCHHYLGPMVYEQRKESHESLSDIREELALVYARKQGREDKLIYCSVSTMGAGSGAFLTKVIEACSGEPTWILLIALGGHPDPSLQTALPENTFIFPWLPQLEALAHADCSLNHAGINTINECIANEVPMVVYSGGKYDQNGCAVRVAHHQLGVMGKREQATPADINRDISEVLNNHIYKDKVAEARERSRSGLFQDRLAKLVTTALEPRQNET